MDIVALDEELGSYRASRRWPQTVAALLPLADTRVWASTVVDDAPASGFAKELRRGDVAPAHATGVEEARLDPASSRRS